MVRSARRRLGAVLGFLCGAWLALPVTPAGAASPTPVCAGTTCTITFAFVGTSQTWIVPPGVGTASSITVFGAQGGAATAGGTGGLGANVTASGATIGGTATIDVGGAGSASQTSGGGGGFGGGGDSLGGSGGGGGFSRFADGGVSLIAGGGGGGGENGFNGVTTTQPVPGGNGGNAGASGSDGGAGSADMDSGIDITSAAGGFGAVGATPGNGGGGGGGDSTCTFGPLTGATGSNGSGMTGGAGGTGGNNPLQGGVTGSSGGGGGGGFAGGGGGGEPVTERCNDAGGAPGGGGGSSAAIGVATSAVTGGVQSGDGLVTISYGNPITAIGTAYSAVAGTPLSVSAAAGVLAPGSASGPTADPLTAVATVQPTHGTVALNADGSFTYTAPAGYTGPDAFGYQVRDGAGDFATATATVTVSAPPPPVVRPAAIAAPAIHGHGSVRQRLTCTTGTWTNHPTRFTYSWERDGTPIAGASGATYTVAPIDEGNTLRCSVTASNAAGAGPAALSRGLVIAVPVVARCPRATGRASATAIGAVSLGETRTRARHAFAHSSNRGRAFEDFFCLTPIGIRVGYASPALIRGLGRSLAGRYVNRVIWISTASAFYAIDGIRPGTKLSSASSRLPGGRTFVVGLNHWYLAPHGQSTAIFKVRGGIVQEIGIAVAALTTGSKAQRTFLTSFH